MVNCSLCGLPGHNRVACPNVEQQAGRAPLSKKKRAAEEHDFLINSIQKRFALQAEAERAAS